MGLGLLALAAALAAPAAGAAGHSGRAAKAPAELGAPGPAARRLAAWRTLLRAGRALDERAKLQRVNRFFNRLRYVPDGRPAGDQWATPREFLARAGGDCEDFALAKYFTLRALGVPRERLRLTYVRALTPNRARRVQAHMVLTYTAARPGPGSDRTLVLDNLEADIRPLSRRPDLRPVYSFNGAGLWLADRHGPGRRVGGAERLSRWQDLLRRMGREARPVVLSTAF